MRNKLRELRLQKGYTQQDMAVLTKMSISGYCGIEWGTRNPSIDKGMRIKKVLGYYNDDLFENTEEGDE